MTEAGFCTLENPLPSVFKIRLDSNLYIPETHQIIGKSNDVCSLKSQDLLIAVASGFIPVLRFVSGSLVPTLFLLIWPHWNYAVFFSICKLVYDAPYLNRSQSIKHFESDCRVRFPVPQ
jgi:hypothetical protein